MAEEHGKESNSNLVAHSPKDAFNNYDGKGSKLVIQ